MLFVLIDTPNEHFFNKYQNELTTIHHQLLNKLSNFDVLIIGNQTSKIASHKFSNAKAAYQFISQYNKDILICDAYAGFLSLDEVNNIYEYTKKGSYDICLTENISEGIVPYVIDKEFVRDLPYFIDEETKLSSDIKKLINWEYQGIDVGIYIAHNLSVLRRVDFLPVNKNAMNYVLELAPKSVFSLDTVEQFIDEHPILLRNNPAYVAIELTNRTDGFYTPNFSDKNDMNLEIFQQIVHQLYELSPEALISLGVWGEPLANPLFEKMFGELKDQHVLIETKCLVLDQSLCELILSRPNTELIFDVTFTTQEDFHLYKKNPYQLSEIQHFIRSLPNQEHIWMRLTRTPESESHIKRFMQEWGDFSPRIIITKTDSSIGGHVVDLSPIKRHSCLALRREMTFLTDGTAMLCRQNISLDKKLGSIQEHALSDLWQKNETNFLNQEKLNFHTCEFCAKCDDWWIWN